MVNFTLNIGEFDEIIKKYKNLKSNFLLNYDSYYGILSNIDMAWNDYSTETFLNVISKNNEDVVNYFKYVDSIYTILENFKLDLNTTLKEYLNKKNSILTYNNYKIQKSLSEISDARTYISDAVDKICSIIYPVPAFSEYELVKKINSELQTINNELGEIYSSIYNFSNNIYVSYTNARTSRNELSNYSPNLRVMNYSWSIQKLPITNLDYEGTINKFNNEYGKKNVSLKNDDTDLGTVGVTKKRSNKDILNLESNISITGTNSSTNTISDNKLSLSNLTLNSSDNKVLTASDQDSDGFKSSNSFTPNIVQNTVGIEESSLKFDGSEIISENSSISSMSNLVANDTEAKFKEHEVTHIQDDSNISSDLHKLKANVELSSISTNV